MKNLLIQAHPTDSAAIPHRKAAQAYRDQLARLFPLPAGCTLALTSVHETPRPANPDDLASSATKPTSRPQPTLTATYDPTDPAHVLWAFFVEDGCPVWDRIALSELALAGLISQRHLL